MWTPLQIAVAAAPLLTYLVVTRINAVGPGITRLNSSQAAVAQQLANGQRDFEKDHHLVVTPPMGTPVVLIGDSHYLREYHGAEAGQLGTVVEHSGLHSDDDGVLVDWGILPNDRVRMDLNELRLAAHA
jgi:hypothetical protein